MTEAETPLSPKEGRRVGSEHFVYPLRNRVGRSAHKPRATTSGITWLPPEQVPGAVLPPETQRRLRARLDAIDGAQARARVTGAAYVIYR